MELLELEKREEFKDGAFLEKKVSGLTELQGEIFENENFSKGDIVLVDNDETLVPTWENFILRKNFSELRQDSRNFLEMCEEREVEKAIITNMPRANHYMNHTTPVFGYDHYFESKLLRKIEFPLTLCLGSLYKETQKSLCEIGAWSMYKQGEGGRIAWIGNSYLDKGFGVRLEKILREEMDFKGDFYFYKLPYIRSFRNA